MSKKDEIEDLVHLETFNIYFHDLREDCQKELCEIFKTTPEKENWDVFPITIIQRVVK